MGLVFWVVFYFERERSGCVRSASRHQRLCRAKWNEQCFLKKLQFKNVTQAESESEAPAQLRWEVGFGKEWINTHAKSSAALIHNGRKNECSNSGWEQEDWCWSNYTKKEKVYKCSQFVTNFLLWKMKFTLILKYAEALSVRKKRGTNPRLIEILFCRHFEGKIIKKSLVYA